MEEGRREVEEGGREVKEGRREAAGENSMEKGKRESVTDLLYALQSNLGNITAFVMCSGVDKCHMCAMFGVAQYRDPVGEFVACLHMGGALTARWEGEDRHSTYNTT